MPPRLGPCQITRDWAAGRVEIWRGGCRCNHNLLTGPFGCRYLRKLVADEGLLTTASDERSGKPAHSRRLAPRPLRPVFFYPAPSRGRVGLITPQSKVLRPYARALRVVGTRKAPRAFSRGRARNRPWAPGRPTTRKNGKRWPATPLRLPGGAARASSAWSASSQPVSARGLYITFRIGIV
jgi:hypothetical protein